LAQYHYREWDALVMREFARKSMQPCERYEPNPLGNDPETLIVAMKRQPYGGARP
jgi:hypothetical protein